MIKVLEERLKYELNNIESPGKYAEALMLVNIVQDSKSIDEALAFVANMQKRAKSPAYVLQYKAYEKRLNAAK